MRLPTTDMQAIVEAYMAGYQDGMSGSMPSGGFRMPNPQMQQVADAYIQGAQDSPKKKRKVSPYHKRLGREIKALRKRHMTKAGKWKKGWSQKRMMEQAHKAAKR